MGWSHRKPIIERLSAASGEATLYNTKIVRWDAHAVRLDHGGYRSQTTLNGFHHVAVEARKPFNVFRNQGVWYVATRTSGVTFVMPFDHGLPAFPCSVPQTATDEAWWNAWAEVCTLANRAARWKNPLKDGKP